MKGHELLDSLIKKLGVTNDYDLALRLGIPQPTVSSWRNSENDLTKTQVVNIISKAMEKATDTFAAQCIKPVVEFYQLDPKESKGGRSWELFDKNYSQYTTGLYKELSNNRGVYVFYDSLGKAIYVGKAAKQTLWKEMGNAYNRYRLNQVIRSVRHPESNQPYKTTDEKTRQIVTTHVCLHDIAVYFSAYSVAQRLIGKVEALLIRSFSNDILNKKMENPH